MEINWSQMNWRVYRRSFSKPLKTGRGVFTERRGILIHEQTNEGKSRFSEIAPWPDFGSETVEDALEFLERSKQQGITDVTIEKLPATSFGLWSLLNSAEQESSIIEFDNTFLGSASSVLLKQALEAERMGFRSQKWKIGQGNLKEELNLVVSILKQLKPDSKIRLDANQSLSHSNWNEWKRLLTDFPQIEYIEEPCSSERGGIEELIQIYGEDASRIALDESINHLENISRFVSVGWAGYWIVKPSIMGKPERWKNLLRQNLDKIVLSSVFETSIGLNPLLTLAHSLSTKHALGLGTLDYFDDGHSPLCRPKIKMVTSENYIQIWDRL